MSADANAWSTPGEGWQSWQGRHDGPCTSEVPHSFLSELSVVITDIETCLGQALRWEIRLDPDGQSRLLGYRT